jgi:transaldolase
MNNLKIKIFSDGANIEEMKQMNSNQLISGLTTNPTLMRKSGITNYLEFVENVLDFVNEKPISFEVFSDDFDEMYHQAHKINEYNKNGNIYIKIPVSNTKGEFSGDLITKLSSEGLSLNVTAVFTEKQVHSIVKLLNKNTKNFISIFCGRIADTGVDPEKLIMNVVTTYKSMNFFEFLSNYDRVPGNLTSTWSQVLDALARVHNSLVTELSESVDTSTTTKTEE